ncbi:amidase [Rhodovulum sp. MB263]|uniref:amidase n=1 Tax=Rhodovulum sp. (strain MB263) TaxID=308754 RepID=UPI001E42089B|nr:amidase family protein [Rhodovulum sp. MB263]
MASDWLGMSAGDLGRGIGTGKIDPVDLTECFLAGISGHPLGERIYARTTRARALAEAGAARERARSGMRLGPLDGVPISWKDLFDSAGIATEAGAALLQGRVPGRDAEVLATASAGGLVCLGKTHMTELAFSGLGVNPVTATPPCINAPKGAPGGSSSGAAASVAFGLAAGAIGSDTGGSVRIPAVWNDLVGLKTTAGRISLKGVVPLCPKFDTVGPLARNVGDAALLLAALEGGRAADLAGARLEGLRFMVLETAAFDGLRDAPRAGFNHALERLAEEGATIVRQQAPEVAEALALAGVLFATEAYGTWRNRIEADPDKMYPPVLDRFRSGRAFSGADYVAAWQTLEGLRATWARRVSGFDAVLMPTCPILPPDVERLLADPDFFMAENLLALRNTRIGNLMGGAVLTLPTGVPATGISFMGLPMSEERLLRIGAAAERALT